MSSNEETGQAKNNANFDHMITIAINHGTLYTPPNPVITVVNLQTALVGSKAALTTLKNSFNVWKNLSNDREILFEPLKHLSTQLLNLLISAKVSKQTVKDFKTINAKIQGTKIGKTHDTVVEPVEEAEATEAIPTIRTISTSQRSFDNLVDHFEKVIILLASIPNYTPTEPEFSIPTLQATFTNMQTLNSTTFDSSTTLSNARISRDRLMYTNPDSLYELSIAVKAYIKGKFGASSADYRQISGISVKKIVSGR